MYKLFGQYISSTHRITIINNIINYMYYYIIII